MTVMSAVEAGRAFAHQGQHVQEITEFLQWAHACGVIGLRPSLGPSSTVVEIGQGQGGLTHTLCLLASRVIGVDLPDGDGGLSQEACEARNAALPDNFVGLLRDSADPTTIAMVIATLAKQPVDLLFIDGDHRGAAPLADYASYGPLVRPGGIIAFHDINSTAHPGVSQLWAWVRERCGGRVWEFSAGETWGGIGAVLV